VGTAPRLKFSLSRPEREVVHIGNCSTRRIENIVEIEGNVEGLERALGEDAEPKYIAIERVKSGPKCGVTIFYSEVVQVDEGETVAHEASVVL
jgi:hypothetical protein